MPLTVCTLCSGPAPSPEFATICMFCKRSLAACSTCVEEIPKSVRAQAVAIKMAVRHECEVSR